MSFVEAASAIEQAEHILITAGAGMGVDSGLPDFRGNEGFWNAYPPYRKLGLNFYEMADPQVFLSDGTLGWGFYGHRLALYRRTTPHEGFGILRSWAEGMKSHFVFTSNVDGQFLKAGFDADRIYEVHGSIHYLQCMQPCSDLVWSAEEIEVAFEQETMRALEPLPSCPRCGALSRPNVLMFGDFSYLSTRQSEQNRCYRSWLAEVGMEKLVVVEMGAGIAVPTVRYQGEQLVRERNARLVRINPRDPEVPEGEISLSMGALEALRAVDEHLS
jgi:NAD-dependent SIR2 family protein deacetylase